LARYLVTGGAGFIGSNLCEDLVKAGHQVSVIDNLTTGSIKNLKGIKVGLEIGKIPNIEYWTPDSLDGIFHLGMPSSIPPYKDNRQENITSVVSEFLYLLDFCKDSGCKIVFASTSNVYSGNRLPWIEGMQIEPKDFYADTRYFLERVAEIYHQFYGVKYVALRLFANYGPRETYKKTWASVISQMIWAKNADKTFKVYGDGNQERDYIFVKDTVRAFRLAMLNNVTSGSFNVGTGISTSFNRLIDIIRPKVEYVNNPVTNYVYSTRANTQLTEASLHFKPEVSLEEGIKCLI